jgi:hypothetical protein
MIALQARSPQLPDPARIGAQYANMMNMARQQEAAQRQAEQAQQEMTYKAAQEARAAETQTSTMREKDQAYRDKEFVNLRNIGKDVSSQQGYEEWLGLVEQANPNIANAYRKNVPVWSREAMQQIVATADDFIAKNIAARVANVEVDADGNLILIQSGGFGGPRVEPAVITNLPGQPSAPPAAAPAAATPTNPMSANAPAPNTAATEPGSLGLVIASALETGIMAQADLDQMLSKVQPESRPKIMNWVRQNGINVAPNTPALVDNQMRGAPADLAGEMRTTPMAYDGRTPQSQFADLRGPALQSQTAGLRGAPPMEQTLAQYQIGQQVKGRNPNVSTAPAETPEQAGRRARLARETEGEVYNKELARARAARIAANEAGPKPLTSVQESKLRENITKDYKSARSTISMMLDPVAGVVATVDKVRKLSPSQKEAITGLSGYLPSLTPGSRSADTAIKNLRGKVTEMGKSTAALTGAIGQMAVQEWRIVSDMIASLDIEGMEPADLDNQLDIIEAQARRAAEVTRDAYENQYVEEFARYPGRFQLPSSTGAAAKTPTAESQMPRVRNNADYNKLKPGAMFIDPNGEKRRKPK